MIFALLAGQKLSLLALNDPCIPDGILHSEVLVRMFCAARCSKLLFR